MKLPLNQLVYSVNCLVCASTNCVSDYHMAYGSHKDLQ